MRTVPGDTMIVSNDHFSLRQTALSGQCFRMTEREDGSFCILARDRYLTAREETDSVILNCTEEDYADFWQDYFDLKTDYRTFTDAVDPEDRYLSEAVRMASGVRILRQDLWEMMVTFLISQRNNIPRIRRCLENISFVYGRRMEAADGTVYHAFPTAESLAGLDENALMACNLGYRSKYVVRCARYVAEGRIDLQEMSSLDYPEMKARLLEIYGIGSKVADCICLFAGHNLEAFPVDTHISQVLEKEYGGVFPIERYRGFEGVIQQYIFWRCVNGDKEL